MFPSDGVFPSLGRAPSQVNPIAPYISSQGGLSSHSLILLLIFYFSNLDTESGCPAAARGDDIPADCLYGEWLLRVVEWLARFPFDTVVRAVTVTLIWTRRIVNPSPSTPLILSRSNSG